MGVESPDSPIPACSRTTFTALRAAQWVNHRAILICHNARMPDERSLSLRQADQLRTNIANLESGLEVIMAQLARQPTRGDLAKTALGLMFCTSVISTLRWWFIGHP